MKLGISLKLDLSKIDKSRIFVGKKGKYLDLTTFVDLNKEDEYGNHGFIAHTQTKEEKASKTNTPICGNTKVFWASDESLAAQNAGGVPMPEQELIDDDIPF